MSVRLASLPFAAPIMWLRVALVAMASLVTAHGAQPGVVGGAEENHTPAMLLAARIAEAGDAGHGVSKPELIDAYEKLYGSINALPAHWPALVRRALVCRETDDHACVQASMNAIDKMGGLSALPLNHLLEVSRFKMSVAAIRARLQNAAQVSATVSRAVSEQEAPPKPEASVVPRAAREDNSAASAAPAAVAESANSAVASSSAARGAGKASAKPAVPRSLLQRASARLQRLVAGNQAAFFLNALFVSVAVSLVLAYLLFAATRARKIASADSSAAARELRKPEAWQTKEKAQMEQALALERSKAKAAIDEAHQVEKLRAAQMLDDERKRGAAMIDAANARADQAIDACAAMTAAELEKTHRQVDELRQALQAEKDRCKAQELKTKEALQASAAFKHMEERLRDATKMTTSELAKALERIDALQLALDREKQHSALPQAKSGQPEQTADALRNRPTADAAETRKLAQQLKSAQRAVIALHASLLTARAHNAELERRAAEVMRSAEQRIADTRQVHALRPEQDHGSGKQPEQGAPAVTSIASNDS